jgi:hypothetical protein
MSGHPLSAAWYCCVEAASVLLIFSGLRESAVKSAYCRLSKSSDGGYMRGIKFRGECNEYENVSFVPQIPFLIWRRIKEWL